MGGEFQPKQVMSGRVDSGESVARLNGRVWTDEVMYVSSVVGHDLSQLPQYDGEIPGQ